MQHAESFMLGYNRGFDDAGVKSDDERRSLIEVPPLMPAEADAEKPNVDEPVVNPTEKANVEATSVDLVMSPSATPTPEA